MGQGQGQGQLEVMSRVGSLVEKLVELHGLTTRTELNGQHGIALSYHADRDEPRYAVRVDDEDMLVRGNNLREVPVKVLAPRLAHPPLQVGTVVLLADLQGESSRRNTSTATILGVTNQSAGRVGYRIRCCTDGHEMEVNEHQARELRDEAPGTQFSVVLPVGESALAEANWPAMFSLLHVTSATEYQRVLKELVGALRAHIDPADAGDLLDRGESLRKKVAETPAEEAVAVQHAVASTMFAVVRVLRCEFPMPRRIADAYAAYLAAANDLSADEHALKQYLHQLLLQVRPSPSAHHHHPLSA